ncbi:MAG: protease modulator HflC [Desulfatiglandaceae bacterium]
MKIKKIVPIVVVLGFIAFMSAYMIDETEQVVVTQFGKVVGTPKTEAGLYFKIPVIQHANYFPKNLLQWDGDPGQVPTLDKTFIWVDTFARWRISDSLLFFQSVNNVNGALSRLDDILEAAVRNFVTSFPLIETVRSTNRTLDTFEIGMDTQDMRAVAEITLGRQQIMKGVLAEAQPKLNQFGIELVDVKIKQLNYVEDVRRSVYDRMIAERKQMAEKFRSEGRGEARKIEGNMNRDLKEIESQAYREAEEIKGRADGEAAGIYARAFGKDPEFYSFIKTLEIYKETMDENSSLVLSTDSAFLQYFKDYNPVRKSTAGLLLPGEDAVIK